MFDTIKRGAIFDRSAFTREALKELRQKAAQDDAKACYCLGIYYLGPLKSGRPKARAFLTKALLLSRQIGDTELEADVRRKLLIVKIQDFFRKYKIPVDKLTKLQEDTRKEVSLIEDLYGKSSNHEGIIALFCDYGENLLPIFFAMLGVTNIATIAFDWPLREKPANPMPAEAQKEIVKSNPILVKRVRHLFTMLTKIVEIDTAMKKRHDERCKMCNGCAKKKPIEPIDQAASNKH